MITKVYIKDNKTSPIHYLSDVKAFTNGKEYIFNPGVNIIVGENGCGKTTLLKLIQYYLMVDYNECSTGEFSSNITRLYKDIECNKIYDGVDIYADYDKNTFRLSHLGERHGESALSDFNTFGTFVAQQISSTGEAVKVAIDSLFRIMFSKDTKLKYDYNQFKEKCPSYYDYVQTHKTECPNEFTILMDEPDRNLSLKSLKEIKSILSFHKEKTQIIAIIHNPLLICALQKYEHINWIEMTDNYIHNISTTIRNLLR